MTRGRFVVVDGIDGCGKSTQAVRLADRLDALATREPGGTELGRVVRHELLHAGHVGPRAEALMMAADRAHHVDTVVRPAIDSGRHVVSDRYLGASVAYQGAGRGLGEDVVEELSLWATEQLWPDLIVWLDVPLDVARSRRVGEADRFEREGPEFWAAVKTSFAEQAARRPDIWARVDGSGSLGDVSARVDLVIADRLGL